MAATIALAGATVAHAEDVHQGFVNAPPAGIGNSYAVASLAAESPAVGVRSEDGVNDPLEPINRIFFGINEIFQLIVLGPVVGPYNGLMPDPIKRGVRNFLDNLNTPVVLANDLLQGEGKRAWQTAKRFAINSTLGVGGFIDAGAKMGIPKHSEDFGQTLAVWGVPEGFYLVLPLFGPSNPRDAIGEFGVDPYFDPLGLWLHNVHKDDIRYAISGADGITTYAGVHEELNQIRKTSIDYYASIRSLYRQKRKAEIANGREMELPPIPNFSSQSGEQQSRTLHPAPQPGHSGPRISASLAH